ncbi:MAG: L,D-transpeptidase family protein [Bdellovibrio bacteriovorus]
MPYRPRSLLLLTALILPWPALALDILGFTETPEPPKAASTAPKAGHRGPTTGPVDRIVVKKAERRLYLMRGDQPFRSYRIALGYQPAGHKQRKGDGRTPEGIYYLDWRSDRSNYRKALHISYPNLQDRLRAERSGDDPGGLIMIHGQPSRRGENRSGDWTFGCIAVSDLAIDEIWSYTSVGTRVEILP